MSLVFFTDRDLGNRFGEILRSGGLTVELHRDHFPPACTDEEWLAEVGARGWVALTHNSRIRYTPNELEAVIRHRVRLVVIVGKAPLADLARSFLATRARVERFIERSPGPLIAKFHRPPTTQLAVNPAAVGTIERWYPAKP